MFPPLRCANAQWNLIRSHLQHSKQPFKRLKRFTGCVSSWLHNCMRSKKNICAMQTFLRGNIACKTHSWASKGFTDPTLNHCHRGSRRKLQGKLLIRYIRHSSISSNEKRLQQLQAHSSVFGFLYDIQNVSSPAYQLKLFLPHCKTLQ